MSCGVYEYADDQLSYSPEIEWPFKTGIAKFVKKALIIDFDDGYGRKRVEIPFRIVESIVATSRPMTALILTLWETPRLFGIQEPDLVALMSALLQKKPMATKTRLTGLPSTTLSHSKIIGQALVYRVCVSPVDFYVLSNQLVQREVVSVIRHDVAILPSYAQLSVKNGMDLLNQTIRELSQTVPFAVMFQVEALARNNFLPPWTVQKILRKIHTRLKEHHSSKWQVTKTVRN